MTFHSSLFVICIFLCGCETIPDETQSTQVPHGLVGICVKSQITLADDHPDAIHNDPMCAEFLR